MYGHNVNMARAIVRTSINGPSPNNQQAQLRKKLESAGFTKIGTGAYEGEFPTTRDALGALRVATDFLDSLPAGFNVDHLWTYLDEDDTP